MVVFWVLAGIANAQATWVQVEAHNSLTSAQDSLRDYADNLKDVNGFSMGSGWYAIALGPYDEEGAIARLQFLRAQRAIPPDAFLVDSSAYSQQFWPIGATALNTPVIEQPNTGQADQTAAVEPQPQAATEPAAPVVAPVPPEETRREALRSESQLGRDERADLQVALQWFGFYNGAIDAAFGPGTRGSMADYQEAKGYDPTGVLTTRQRDELLGDYQAVLASLGLRLVRDDVAGIEVELPLAMVAHERYDPPFAHYTAKGDSGVKVLLISQTGDQATLLGLFDIMQTLEIVPLAGERNRRNDSFTLTGENPEITSYTYAVLTGGAVKGFTLIWPAGDDARREVTLKAMRDSFRPIEGAVLPDAYGDGALDAKHRSDQRIADPAAGKVTLGLLHRRARQRADHGGRGAELWPDHAGRDLRRAGRGLGRCAGPGVVAAGKPAGAGELRPLHGRYSAPAIRSGSVGLFLRRHAVGADADLRHAGGRARPAR